MILISKIIIMRIIIMRMITIITIITSISIIIVFTTKKSIFNHHSHHHFFTTIIVPQPVTSGHTYMHSRVFAAWLELLWKPLSDVRMALEWGAAVLTTYARKAHWLPRVASLAGLLCGRARRAWGTSSLNKSFKRGKCGFGRGRGEAFFLLGLLVLPGLDVWSRFGLVYSAVCYFLRLVWLAFVAGGEIYRFYFCLQENVQKFVNEAIYNLCQLLENLQAFSREKISSVWVGETS